jgi:MYXO-CTERM domain-containing protein
MQHGWPTAASGDHASSCDVQSALCAHLVKCMPDVEPGSKAVTALAAAVLAALWARRSNARQQRLATAKPPESLLGRIRGAVAARLQVRNATLP